jgi:hypothetical protein
VTVDNPVPKESGRGRPWERRNSLMRKFGIIAVL